MTEAEQVIFDNMHQNAYEWQQRALKAEKEKAEWVEKYYTAKKMISEIQHIVKNGV